VNFVGEEKREEMKKKKGSDPRLLPFWKYQLCWLLLLLSSFLSFLSCLLSGFFCHSVL